MKSESKRILLTIQRNAINPITDKPMFRISDEVLRTWFSSYRRVALPQAVMHIFTDTFIQRIISLNHDLATMKLKSISSQPSSRNIFKRQYKISSSIAKTQDKSLSFNPASRYKIGFCCQDKYGS